MNRITYLLALACLSGDFDLVEKITGDRESLSHLLNNEQLKEEIDVFSEDGYLLWLACKNDRKDIFTRLIDYSGIDYSDSGIEYSGNEVKFLTFSGYKYIYSGEYKNTAGVSFLTSS